MSTTCHSCGASIFWAKTESGKAMPVDAKPSPKGTLVLRYPEHVGDTVVLDDDEPATMINANKAEAPDGEPRFASHFATCPQAAAHRKPKAKKEGENP
jgi:hypothetical protein